MVEKFDLLKYFGVYGVAIDNEKLLVIEKKFRSLPKSL